jgi:hypothetical protein
MFNSSRSKFDATSDTPTSPSRIRMVIVVLAVLVLILAAVNLLRNKDRTVTSQKGAVRGVVVDLNNRPLRAEVLVLGTNLAVETGEQGLFEIQRVPAGPQILIIGYQAVGVEYPVVIEADVVIDLGPIQIDAGVGLDGDSAQP